MGGWVRVWHEWWMISASSWVISGKRELGDDGRGVRYSSSLFENVDVKVSVRRMMAGSRSGRGLLSLGASLRHGATF